MKIERNCRNSYESTKIIWTFFFSIVKFNAFEFYSILFCVVCVDKKSNFGMQEKLMIIKFVFNM